MGTLLPNAVQTFTGPNGTPLSGGSVYFYIPGTTTPKNTWQDPNLTVLNTNPVILNANGQAIIWGSGEYRQQVYDAVGNLIWDQVTEDTSAGLLGNMTDARFVVGTDFTPGVTTQLTLPAGPGSLSNLWVFFDAAFQADDQIASLVGSLLTFSNPIPVGVQEVNVKIGNTVAIGTPGAGTITDASVASNAAIQSSKLSYLASYTGAIARTVQSKLSDIVSVKDYGAKGDGSTDDLVSFQKAFAALIAQGGGTLFIPPGRYMLSAAISVAFAASNQGITVLGAAPEAVQLVWASGGGLSFTYSDYTNSVTVENLSLTTRQQGSGTALSLVSTTAVADPISYAPSLIKNVIMRGDDQFLGTDYWGSCCNIASVSNVNLEGVGMYGQGGQYTVVGGGLTIQGSSSAYAVAINLIGCFIQNVGTAILYQQYSQGLNLIGTNITACALGVQIPPSQAGVDQLTMTGCQINCSLFGVRDQTGITGIAVSGNYFIIPYISGNSPVGVGLFNALAPAISGNQFHRENALITNTTGVVIFSGIAAIVSGNSFFGTQTGIWFQAGTTTCVAEGNSYNGCTNNIVNSTTANNDCFDQRYRTTIVVSIGAVGSFQVSVPLPAQIFNAAPQEIFATQGDWSTGMSQLLCIPVAGSSSATQAVFNVYPLGGGNIVAGSYRFDVLAIG
ncbi:pectate lyase-like protein [Paraburkholderia silvatlantica]|uniref:Pectate lyase-like protein n=1 Tax=Paraburkholderia silvatlantica TaxID=321895 RepID=A0A2V4UAE6_9BURK|nr:glycosyl hydrolase family 28-related protein [Paraburkholderia silvatlantica]PYE21327.1 pectate lyase-like protein [Paraburkholderia silvatlantica]